MKKLNKKGFTLAELLIVVAIIAVLVAIAVPLFVGSLSNAQEARDNANIRAVRGAAVVYLLEHTTDTEKLWKTPSNGWNVEAIISASGEISGMKINNETATGDYTEKGKVTSDTNGFKVTLHLSNTEITASDLTTGG